MITNFFPPSYTGGAEVANYQLLQGLRRRGVDVQLLFVNNRLMQTVDDYYDYDGIPVHRINLTTTMRSAVNDVYDMRVYQAVLRELRDFKPDLAHIQNISGATLAPYFACAQAKVSVVNTLHDLGHLCPNNMLYRENGVLCDPAQSASSCGQCFRRYDYWGNTPLRRKLFLKSTRSVRYFISPSQALIEMFVKAGYDRNRFRLIRYSIWPDIAMEPSSLTHPGLREIIEAAAQRPTLLYAGGGIEIKGAQTLIEAIPIILRHRPEIQIVLAGGGEPRFLDAFRQLGPNVHELGRVPFREILALYQTSHLALVPSVWYENSPVVIYQSMQVGLPVVGSDMGGTPELIREGETGYIFAAHNPSALAEKVLLHFARPTHIQRQMRQNCLLEARENLNPDRHLERVLELYREVMA